MGRVVHGILEIAIKVTLPVLGWHKLLLPTPSHPTRSNHNTILKFDFILITIKYLPTFYMRLSFQTLLTLRLMHNTSCLEPFATNRPIMLSFLLLLLTLSVCGRILLLLPFRKWSLLHVVAICSRICSFLFWVLVFEGNLILMVAFVDLLQVLCLLF